MGVRLKIRMQQAGVTAQGEGVERDHAPVRRRRLPLSKSWACSSVTSRAPVDNNHSELQL